MWTNSQVTYQYINFTSCNKGKWCINNQNTVILYNRYFCGPFCILATYIAGTLLYFLTNTLECRIFTCDRVFWILALLLVKDLHTSSITYCLYWLLEYLALLLRCLFLPYCSVSKAPKHMLRTISLCDDGIQPPGHFLVCILFLYKIKPGKRRGSPVSWTGTGKSHILSNTHFNNNTWGHKDVFHGIKVIF